MGNGTTLAAQLDNIRNGRAYVNFHSSQFSGGEIRGDFLPLQTFRDYLVAGLNGATLTRATVLRMISEFPSGGTIHSRPKARPPAFRLAMAKSKLRRCRHHRIKAG